MKDIKVLITAANGHTGFPAAKELLRLGFSVRAFVRNSKAKKAALLGQLGAELFVGNIEDINDVRNALEGISRVYFVPTYPNLLFQGETFINALEESKVEHVVLLTQWLSSNRHPSVYTKEHWLVDQAFKRQTKSKVTLLNPGLFAFVYFMTPEPLTQFGMLPDFGNNAPPSNEDIGLVAAHILKDPEKHKDKSYRITGDELLTAAQMAKIIGEALGRKVKASKMSFPMIYKVLRASGYPQMDASQVKYYVEEAHRGAFAFKAPNNTVRDIVGKEPDNFKTITERYLLELPISKQGFGNKIRGMLFMMKVLFTKSWKMDSFERKQGFPAFKNMEYAMDSVEWVKSH
ncbi:NmrA family NAD(P)-binding protein [Flagellimonas lutimaris]|uniref:NmrA family NAD(P)-binding protein n=1 Tax=Flagellimonas lutimaris TaxID=475082 RepID=UPI003F5CBDA8